ncbi:hypothetical protein GCM10010435_44950 [Winogradskya consettensis]|uniref:Uncharacterized protein n=2 Tax=Winogradskya TaxID=3240235 RepID=A0A919W6A5_9ACTN|nr:hypothetical protein [Actinoplanes consettensis]GIE19652.1 hypothetical protein Ahu01nite_027540 [Actinoplanes humidus]GIM82802.1 hypothetical protein Aco04nite_83340 [Actinoplanes consettensis]
MTAFRCGAEAIQRRGGPVQVPLQPCCVAALLRAARTSEWVRCPFQELLVPTLIMEGSR